MRDDKIQYDFTWLCSNANISTHAHVLGVWKKNRSRKRTRHLVRQELIKNDRLFAEMNNQIALIA